MDHGLDDAPAGSASIPDLCRAFLGPLPISGVSITIVTASGSQSSLCSSDETAARIEELQFELGEGPQWSSARSGELVTIADVAAAGHDNWPIFGAALAELPVGAIFSVPMRMGAVTVGVATLYCDRPRTLDPEQQATALAIASAIASTAVQRAMLSASDEVTRESALMPALRREVHQATGMILVQLDTSATVAYSRLQAYAFANGQSVQAVAHDVVTGKLTFTNTTR
jgi:GAF domain-containing protein